jgi:hypothetical protein
MSEPVDPRPVFDFALANYPHLLQVTTVADVMVGSRRARPDVRRPASIELAVPDETVVNLRGEHDRQDLLLLVRIPREVIERSQSLVITPGELR